MIRQAVSEDRTNEVGRAPVGARPKQGARDRRLLPLVVIGLLVAGLLLALLYVALSQRMARTPRIDTPHGIATLEEVEVNGSKQWISVRGQDINRPVLLFLAGGPGGSELAMTRLYLGKLEEHFVVVNWEQPGTGKSFNAMPLESLTPERYLADGLALTQYLQARFQQEKIYLLGESWGAILGVWMAQAAPSRYHALVTSGQMVNTTENDRVGYDLAIDYLETNGRTRAADALRRQGPPPYVGRGMTQKYMAFMDVQNESMAQNAKGEGVQHNLLFDSMRAPEYGALDKLNWLRGLAAVFAHVYPQLDGLDLRQQAPKLDVPVFFVKGRWDINALNPLTQEYFDLLEAPHKQLIWFENSAHTPLWDEPVHFVDVMVNTVLAQTQTQTQPQTQSQATGQGESQSGATAAYAAYFDDQIPHYLREYGIPGAVVSVVQGGSPLFVKGYGYANVAAQTAMDGASSVVHIGSIGKLFTTMAVLQLAEEGRVDLDADIAHYLDFALPATFAQPITLRHLLSHTSGLRADDAGAIVLDAASVPVTRDYLLRRLPTRLQPPGESVGYSNYGMTLAGYIVERMSGEPLGEYIQAHLLAPLAMTSSEASLLPSAQLATSMATGYAAGEPAGTEYIAAYGAAPVRATAPDMARFMLANLQNGTLQGARVLQPASAQAMRTPQIEADARANVTGLGLYQMSRNGKAMWGHLGSTGYFHSLMLLIPDDALGIFVSFNAAEGAQVLRTERFMADLTAAFFPTEVQAVTPDAAAAARTQAYAGRYFFNTLHGNGWLDDLLNLLDMVSIRPTPDGRLRTAFKQTGQTFTEIAPDLFQRADGGDLLAFHRNADGDIHSVSLNSRPVFTLQRGGWLARPLLTGIASLGIALAVVVALIALPWLFFRRRARRRAHAGR